MESHSYLAKHGRQHSIRQSSTHASCQERKSRRVRSTIKNSSLVLVSSHPMRSRCHQARINTRFSASLAVVFCSSARSRSYFSFSLSLSNGRSRKRFNTNFDKFGCQVCIVYEPTARVRETNGWEASISLQTSPKTMKSH